MKTSIKTSWKENMAFESRIGEHNIVTDAPVDVGGDNSGASPKKLMMASLAGCTGIDVVLILKKMRVNIDDLIITVDAVLTEEVPSVYQSMNIIYEFSGNDLDVDKLQRAVELSQEKYCGVSIMYKRIMDITWEIKYQT
ncbi:MAG: osmotically inducible protein C [Desulfobulbaceae bacterium S3730MH12]|nr:MAG: osmotically inducible protein C [Desulfobulbaceae bacterium S3730MH12]